MSFLLDVNVGTCIFVDRMLFILGVFHIKTNSSVQHIPFVYIRNLFFRCTYLVDILSYSVITLVPIFN